ncbi:helix-turn-helix domain-containing protein [Streptomyces varsoviensis]|uniref:helix-turn-helix domain-containing protein n=1 Tax=Streptomyces varsoviensis TaxID=67373 RepID=UPI0033E00716
MSEPYRERPSAAVRGAVVWTRTATGEPGRVLPDGCVDLLWMGGRLLVAGPDTRAHLPSQAPGDRCSGLPAAALAADVGLGERQLHRRCLNAFGYGPKTLARVLRMNRALESARAGRPYAEVAAEAGYADQAHLAREVKSLAGVPLGGPTARAGPPSPTGPSHGLTGSG